MAADTVEIPRFARDDTAGGGCQFAERSRQLGFADSMSAYYIYQPAEGATDADREVISNINPRGLDVPKAAVALAEACARILRDKKSGVVF